MRTIKNMMSIGERPEAYTLYEIIYNIYDEFKDRRWNYVPLSIFFVDTASSLELRTLEDIREYGECLPEDGAVFEIIRTKEAYRYNEEINEICFSVVLEEVY